MCFEVVGGVASEISDLRNFKVGDVACDGRDDKTRQTGHAA